MKQDNLSVPNINLKRHVVTAKILKYFKIYHNSHQVLIPDVLLFQ